METKATLQARIAELEAALAEYMQRYGATDLARRVMIAPQSHHRLDR